MVTTIVVLVTLSLLAIKTLTIGSDFDFISWFRWGHEYTRWYFHRETWWDYRVKGGR